MRIVRFGVDYKQHFAAFAKIQTVSCKLIICYYAKSLTAVFDALRNWKGLSRVQRNCPINWVRRPHHGLGTLNPRRFWRGFDHRFTEIVNIIFKGRRRSWGCCRGSSSSHSPFGWRPRKRPPCEIWHSWGCHRSKAAGVICNDLDTKIGHFCDWSTALIIISSFWIWIGVWRSNE